MRQLRREEARRIAVRAQLLDANRPRDLLTVVERLTLLQLDPTAAVAPNADLVLWSRIGNAYEPAHLQCALEQDRTLFEHRAHDTPIEPALALLRPTSHLGLYLADMAAWPHGGPRLTAWMTANDGFRRRVLAQLETSGPLPSRDIPDTCEVPWESTGWTNDRNTTQMLEFLASHGDVAVAGRRGRQRLWDLADRIHPRGTKVVPAAKALRIRNENRLRALGVARPQYVGDAGEPAEIEGTSGVWRVDPDATAEGFAGRTALLSPFDRLIHDRVRAMDVFDFEYSLEMYKPAAQRRWGYFALPVLHGDRLVGKVDALADRKSKQLVVNAIRQDVRFTKPISAGVDAEFHALAQWLGMEVRFSPAS